MTSVVAFSGHRFVGGDDAEGRVATAMADLLARHRVVAGHGSLAAGADLLWAEALAARGAEVHVVLPFDADRFLETSVRPVGERWVTRFWAQLRAAASVEVIDALVTSADAIDDDAAYAIAARDSQSAAVHQALRQRADPRLMVVWDGAAATGGAGTAADVEHWRRLGHPVDIISTERATG